jgi:hypothetical protein
MSPPPTAAPPGPESLPRRSDLLTADTAHCPGIFCETRIKSSRVPFNIELSRTLEPMSGMSDRVSRSFSRSKSRSPPIAGLPHRASPSAVSESVFMRPHSRSRSKSPRSSDRHQSPPPIPEASDRQQPRAGHRNANARPATERTAHVVGSSLSSYVRRIRVENEQSRDRSDRHVHTSSSLSADESFVWSAHCDFSQYVGPLSCELCLHNRVVKYRSCG